MTAAEAFMWASGAATATAFLVWVVTRAMNRRQETFVDKMRRTEGE